MYEAKFGENQVQREVCAKIKVVQNGLKHILVLKFLKFDEILKVGNFL